MAGNPGRLMVAAVIRVLVNRQRPRVRLRRTQRWSGRVHPQPGAVVGGQTPADRGEDLWGPREHRGWCPESTVMRHLGQRQQCPEVAQRRGPLATHVKMPACLGGSDDIFGEVKWEWGRCHGWPSIDPEEMLESLWISFEEDWLIFNR